MTTSDLQFLFANCPRTNQKPKTTFSEVAHSESLTAEFSWPEEYNRVRDVQHVSNIRGADKLADRHRSATLNPGHHCRPLERQWRPTGDGGSRRPGMRTAEPMEATGYHGLPCQEFHWFPAFPAGSSEIPLAALRTRSPPKASGPHRTAVELGGIPANTSPLFHSEIQRVFSPAAGFHWLSAFSSAIGIQRLPPKPRRNGGRHIIIMK
ncbi:hypothetical protein FB451DRAFT_1486102 [Mycena latifolia]|nr:hypothetical protein FB451DRAFT_1486102 [Mycena latifolia]